MTCRRTSKVFFSKNSLFTKKLVKTLYLSPAEPGRKCSIITLKTYTSGPDNALCHSDVLYTYISAEKATTSRGLFKLYIYACFTVLQYVIVVPIAHA